MKLIHFLHLRSVHIPQIASREIPMFPLPFSCLDLFFLFYPTSLLFILSRYHPPQQPSKPLIDLLEFGIYFSKLYRTWDPFW